MAKAISYIRFSSDRQKFGSSHERQQDLINEWLLKNPTVKLSDLNYQDLGKSGYKGDHLKNAFGDMLEAIQENKISTGDYILAEAIDRIGRLERTEMINIITSICTAGVKIITLEDGQEYSKNTIDNDAGLIYLLIGKVDAAHSHSKKLSRGLTKSYEIKRKAAEAGQSVKRKTPWWLTWNDKTECYDELTPANKVLMNDIFTWYLNGLSPAKIIQRMQSYDDDLLADSIGSGELKHRFEKLSPTGLKKMLMNKTAIGYWGDNSIYPKAVDEVLFYQVQAEIPKRGEQGKRCSRSGHVLAGLVICSSCGSNFTIKNQKHSSTTMKCPTANKGHCDNTPSVPVKVINHFRLRTQTKYLQKISDAEIKTESDSELIIIDGQLSDIKIQLNNWLSGDASSSRTAAKAIMSLELQEDELLKKRAGIVASDARELSFSNWQKQIKLAPDSSVLNAMLIKIGYKIMANNKILTVDNESIKYVSYANNKGHLIIADGEPEYI